MKHGCSYNKMVFSVYLYIVFGIDFIVREEVLYTNTYSLHADDDDDHYYDNVYDSSIKGYLILFIQIFVVEQ